MWAGGLMGLVDGELETYVLSLVREDLRQPGDQDVYDKVLADLAGQGLHVDPHEVRAQMDLCLAQARQEVSPG
jgi:hypothetical protein